MADNPEVYRSVLDSMNPPAPGPNLATKAVNFGKALVKHAVNRFGKAGEALQAERLAICQGCEWRSEGTCTHQDCGCVLELKTSWASESCPVGKWDAIASNSGCKGCGK